VTEVKTKLVVEDLVTR